MNNKNNNEMKVSILYKYKTYREIQDAVDYKNIPLNTEMNMFIIEQLNKLNEEYKKITGNDIEKY